MVRNEKMNVRFVIKVVLVILLSHIKISFNFSYSSVLFFFILSFYKVFPPSISKEQDSISTNDYTTSDPHILDHYAK